MSVVTSVRYVCTSRPSVTSTWHSSVTSVRPSLPSIMNVRHIRPSCPSFTSCLSLTSVHHVRPWHPSLTSLHHVCLLCLSITFVCHLSLSHLSITSVVTSIYHVRPSRPSIICLFLTSVRHVRPSCLSFTSDRHVCQRMSPKEYQWKVNRIMSKDALFKTCPSRGGRLKIIFSRCLTWTQVFRGCIWSSYHIP